VGPGVGDASGRDEEAHEVSLQHERVVEVLLAECGRFLFEGAPSMGRPSSNWPSWKRLSAMLVRTE
jgi:hypothetical protein